MNFKFRLAHFDDVAAIRQLSEKTFRDTYSEHNTPENMEQHVEKNFALQQIEKELKQIDSQYIIIDLNGEIIAFSKLVKNRSTKGLEEKNVVEKSLLVTNRADVTGKTKSSPAAGAVGWLHRRAHL